MTAQRRSRPLYPGDPYSDGEAPTWNNPTYSSNRFGHSALELHDIMLRNGDSRPMWLTEDGYTTVDPACVKAGLCWTPSLPKDEATQARYLGEAIGLVRQWPYVDAYLWYELVDGGGADSLAPEAHFGLYRRDLGEKPAAAKFGETARGAAAAPSSPPQANQPPTPPPTPRRWRTSGRSSRRASASPDR